MPANLLCSHLSYSSPSYSPCSWTGYYVFMSIIINTFFIITSTIAKKKDCIRILSRTAGITIFWPLMSKTIFAYSSKTVQCGVSTSKITRTKPWIGCCDLIAIQQCREQISKVNSSMSTFSWIAELKYLSTFVKLQVIHWSWWSIFIPLWIWKGIAISGAAVGSYVWWRRPQSRLNTEEYIQYKAMLISLATHLLLLMFELLAADNLDTRRHKWILVFIPLTVVR